MEKSKKMIKNLLLFILLIALTFYIILKDQDVGNIFNIIKTVDLKFVLIAIIFMAVYLILESVNLGRTLKALGEKSNIFKNFKYALIGFFFSAITPAASGGQPMQIYYMHKDKISVANSTLALLVNLCSFQIITLTFAFISVFLNTSHLNSGLVCFFIIGVSLNMSALALLLIGIFSKKLSAALIRFAEKILKKLKIKNLENKVEKLESELKEHRILMLKTLVTTFIQVLFYYSITYLIYCAFGLNGYNAFQLITLQSVLYATVSGIPSPGAVGVTEGGFLSLFNGVFPNEIISSAMLLNRGVSFYLYVLLSGIFVSVISIKTKKETKKDV